MGDIEDEVFKHYLGDSVPQQKSVEQIKKELSDEVNENTQEILESLKVKLKIVNKSDNPNPQYKHVGDSGFDLRAMIDSGHIHLEPLERKLIHTGIYMDIPNNYEVQVRPRSGMALKLGLGVLNSPGTVDDAYTGEVGVIAVNLSNETIQINHGDRIAQAVLCPVLNQRMTNIEIVDEITKITDRGSDGYGSTGKN